MNNITPERRLELQKILHLLEEGGQVKGSHHKAWYIDQITKILLGTEMYIEFTKDLEDWDKGIAP